LGDVATGIAQLSKDLTPSSAGVTPSDARPTGSGKLQIKQVRFLDPDDQPIAEINVGEPVTVAIDYFRRDAFIRSAVLDVAIQEDSSNIFQRQHQFDEILERGQLRLTVKYMPLNVEYLDFAVALLDRRTSEIFDWRRELRLRVRPNALHPERLFLPTEWTHVVGPQTRSDGSHDSPSTSRA
jgi:hypothetical protein